MKSLQQIQAERVKIVNKYSEFFFSRGYKSDKPAPLVTGDNSILFTNSTIVPWKGYLGSAPIPNQGIFMTPPQPCLRVQALNDNIGSFSQYEISSTRSLGYFNMVGLLCEKDKAQTLPHDVIDLLLGPLAIKSEDIKILVSEKNNFLSGLDDRVDIVRESEHDSDYRWTYGSGNEVVGEGAKIRFRQKDNNFVSIGQIIEITTPKKVCYEFGFGVETFLARATQDQTYGAWTINHCVPENYRFKVLLDLFSCLGAALTIPKELLEADHKKEIRRISRRISKLETVLDIPLEVANESIVRFINLEFEQDLGPRVFEELNCARTSS